MTQSLRQELDALAHAAEDAAIHLDGPRLEQAMQDLTSFATRLRDEEPDLELIADLRQRMLHFIALCRFVQDLLRELITGERELPGYAETGRIAARTSGSVVHRYG